MTRIPLSLASPSPQEPVDQEVVGHGTHVAGIVQSRCSKGATMPLRVLDREGLR